jgi:hypothetical protein
MRVVVMRSDRAVINIVLHASVDVVDGAVVVEVASTPVAPLIAIPDVSKAVIDAAIVADVLAPVTGVKPVVVI